MSCHLSAKNPKRKIGAVVVLYNPDADVIENLKPYIKYLDCCVVVDNSDDENDVSREISNDDRIIYVPLKCNQGIATALNVGINRLKSAGMTIALTMDQDSKIIESEFDSVLKIVDEKIDDYSIIALSYDSFPIEKSDEIIQTGAMITSGNFLKISAFDDVNGFDEKLFIDWVDLDFGYRLTNAGHIIGRLKDYSIIQKIGEPVKKSLFGKTFVVMNHSPVRYYYSYRNISYLNRINRDFFGLFYRRCIMIDTVKMILFEEKKIEKIKMICKGVRDSRKNVFGKYNQ